MNWLDWIGILDEMASRSVKFDKLDLNPGLPESCKSGVGTENR